jgi:hypothetical protein
MPAFNDEFKVLACEKGSTFIPWIGECLDDILCEQYKRIVNRDNCVQFEDYSCRYLKTGIAVTM